jgi:hypothetical protein
MEFYLYVSNVILWVTFTFTCSLLWICQNWVWGNVLSEISRNVYNITWHYIPYQVVSKIFRTGAAIYRTVVVARSTGPNSPNCELRALPRRLAATAWKLAQTSLRTSARTDLTASPWQRPVSHFRPHPAVSGEIQNAFHPPPTVLTWFDTLWLFPISKNETEA